MSFQTPIPIAQAIRNIEANAYLLPAIQREFVWGHEQIERLFDSIMQSYPFSSFLFWRVQPETATKFQFYRFLRDYQERWNTHNELHDTRGLSEFTAILDGQQRLTSLFIGLRGTFAYKTPRLWDDRYSDKVYPKRKLYLNVRHHVTESEDSRKYGFRFLSKDEFDQAPNDWFEVGKIMGLTSLSELNRFLKETGWRDDEFASDTLSRLQEAIHTTACINYFQETDQALDKALNIFIRINSGGEPLNFSDLVMSIAVAKWQGARQEIHKLVDDVGNLGFKISKDFVLKVALLRHSEDIKFKVDNFGNEVAEAFRDHWDSTRLAILEGFRLVRSFGHTDKTLVSKNAVLPIIYYLIDSSLSADFVAGFSFKEDRVVIRRWLNSILLNRNFGTHSDQILKRLRDKMKGCGNTGFPLAQILEAARDIGSVLGGVVFVLENARRHFQRAGSTEDADRMQRAKQSAAKAHPLHSSEGRPIPEALMRVIQARYEVKRDAWLADNDSFRFGALIQDFFGLRPFAFVPQPPGISDVLESFGVVQSMELRPDGRSANAPAPDPQLRRWWDANTVHHQAVLATFLDPFLAWCREDQPESLHPTGSIQGFKAWVITSTLAQDAHISPTTNQILTHGMAAFLQGMWLPCLAVWIPCFERALRERLDDLGVQVFSHQSHPGVEHALLLDSLIERASDHFSTETVLYWKHWFGQGNGVGHNLRNEHCHGFLEAEQYQGWIALGTLFAFLFLLAPLSESDALTPEAD